MYGVTHQGSIGFQAERSRERYPAGLHIAQTQNIRLLRKKITKKIMKKIYSGAKKRWNAIVKRNYWRVECSLCELFDSKCIECKKLGLWKLTGLRKSGPEYDFNPSELAPTL